MRAPNGPAHRLLSYWEGLRSSLWFVPTLLVLSSIALAVGLIEAEGMVEREQLVREWPRLFGAGAQGARAMLSAIASSMITVAGVAFSVTIVTFSLASSQYTSRILRNFMRDRANQAVLGFLLGVFAYCLVVLRTIRGGEEGMFVPSLAVLAAVILALVAIGVLVFFIHHVAASIQASSVIQSVAEETTKAIDRLYPNREEAGLDAEPAVPDLSGVTWSSIPARTSGYLQAVDRKTLVREANARDTVIRVEQRVGEFVTEGLPLAALAGRQAEPELIDRVNGACIVGRHRTLQEDAAYGIRQLVDIALKALSPGINDTTTAVICIDYLGAVVVRLAERQLDSRAVTDHDRVRVLLRGRGFRDFLLEAFDQIRANAGGNAVVLEHLLDVLAIVARRTSGERAREVQDQAAAIMETADRTVSSRLDRERLEAAAERCSRSSSSR